MNMISVEQALEYILQHFRPLEPEAVPILDALDRVLAADIVSDVDVPPFDNSAMDGYAVRAEDVAAASPDHPTVLQVTGDVAAGYLARGRVERGTSIRIMTGAPLPDGADSVVRFEETSEGLASRHASNAGGATSVRRAETVPGKASGGESGSRGAVEIIKPVQRGENVRSAGEDIRAREVVLRKGTVVRPAEIGILASLGRKELQVHRRPRVAILATGDELVTIDEPVLPGRIRNSNEYSNAAAVFRAGGIPIRLGIARDNIDDLTARMRAGLDAGADLFLTSAGVSVGDYDIVKDVLNAQGEMHFWQVRMKPGKPLAFGILRGKKPVPLLGLPGNPVSAMISFEVFARPAILTMLGKTRLARPTVRAVLQEDVQNTADRRNFIRVVVDKADGGLTARMTGEQGSGILTSVSRANGLLVVPEEVRLVRKGETVDVAMLDWPEW